MIAAGRALFGGALVLAWIGALGNLPDQGKLETLRLGIAGLVPPWIVLHPAALGVATAVIVVAAVALAVDRAERVPLWAAWAFVPLFLYARVEQAADFPPGVAIGHGKFMMGGCLAGMAAAGLVYRSTATDGGVQRGLNASAGVIAALYTWAGMAKLRVAGLDWVHASNLPMLIYERSFSSPEPFASMRVAISQAPTFCAIGGWIVLAIELSGVCFLAPALQIPFAITITGMHLSIGVILGYPYPDWILAVWGVTLWSRGLAARRASAVPVVTG